MAIVNDYELVVAGVAGVLAPYADRVEVVELDSRMPVISDVDVILYDTFGQPQGDAVQMTDLNAHLADHPARVLIFSWNVDDGLVQRALAAGAAGYVAKSVAAADLVAAIERVHAGEIVTPAPTAPEAEASDDFGRWPGAELGLSPRESEVMALICQGLSNDEIAERAFIGINTVKTYVRTLYRKIEVGTRAQAVLWGVEHGFLPDRSRRLASTDGTTES